MGISANDFWAKSPNGKAMTMFIAQRGDVEVVRDICDWLVGRHKNDFKNSALKRGANEEQAKAFAHDKVAGLDAEVLAINDRNLWHIAEKIIDTIFFPYFKKGPNVYGPAMKWFADELRGRVKSVPGDVDFTGAMPNRDWMKCKCHPSRRKPHPSGVCLECGGLLN